MLLDVFFIVSCLLLDQSVAIQPPLRQRTNKENPCTTRYNEQMRDEKLSCNLDQCQSGKTKWQNVEKLTTSLFKDAGICVRAASPSASNCEQRKIVSIPLLVLSNVPHSSSFRPSVRDETFWRLMFICRDTLLAQCGSEKCS